MTVLHATVTSTLLAGSHLLSFLREQSAVLGGISGEGQRAPSSTTVLRLSWKPVRLQARAEMLLQLRGHPDCCLVTQSRGPSLAVPRPTEPARQETPLSYAAK